MTRLVTPPPNSNEFTRAIGKPGITSSLASPASRLNAALAPSASPNRRFGRRSARSCPASAWTAASSPASEASSPAASATNSTSPGGTPPSCNADCIAQPKARPSGSLLYGKPFACGSEAPPAPRIWLKTFAPRCAEESADSRTAKAAPCPSGARSTPERCA
jgi:hypothetical protein